MNSDGQTSIGEWTKRTDEQRWTLNEMMTDFEQNHDGHRMKRWNELWQNGGTNYGKTKRGNGLQ